MRIEAALPRAEPGVVTWAIPGLARVHLRAGAEVELERDPRTTDVDVAWLLEGPVRQAQALLNGIFGLRAASVVIDGRAVALVGGPACGKSLTAAALALRGHPVLSDTWLPVESDATARPTGQNPGLWPGAWALLERDPTDGTVVRPALAKRTLAVVRAEEPAPLAAIVVLRRDTGVDGVTTDRLTGAPRAAVVRAATAMLDLVDPLGMAPAYFVWMTRLAAAVAVLGVTSDRHARDADAVADAVEAIAATAR